MFAFIKNMFVPKIPTPQLVAANELNEARLDLLKAQKECEYWQSMVPMLVIRTRRLAALAAADNNN